MQLDNEIYENDETIWFKAIVLNSFDHKPTTLSGVLIVELISDSKEILQSKLIKLEEGIGLGHFDLDAEYQAGTFLLRAYTEWDRNFEDKFIFEKYIKIYSTSQKVDLIEDTEIFHQSSFPNLTVRYNSDFGDTIDIKKYSLKYSNDKIERKVIIQKDKNGRFFSELFFDEDLSNLKLSLVTDNKILETKYIRINEDDFDLQFFPEGGELVNGIVSRVGFKFCDKYGKGFQGIFELLSEDGDVLHKSESNHLGMGSFYFYPNHKEKYSVRAKSLNDSIWQRQKFIDVNNFGTVLSVDKNSDVFKLGIQSTNSHDSISIEVISRGYNFFNLKGKLSDGKFYATINCGDLPEGLLVLRVLSEKDNSIAERLIFNEREDQRLIISHRYGNDKNELFQRDKSEFSFEVLEPNGKISEANLSIKVINIDQLGDVQKGVNSIVSHVLLTSELNGIIEKPYEYFTQGRVVNYKYLDDLLLTQGWRKYNYSELGSEIIEFSPEKGLEISGTVKGISARKSTRQGIDLTMMSFGTITDIQNQKSDSLGMFYFPLRDEYGEKIDVLIQSKKKEGGRNLEYNISIEERLSPEVNFQEDFEMDMISPKVKYFLEQNQLRRSIDNAFRLEEAGFELEEVEVRDTRLSPEREKLYKDHGEPDVVIDGDEIREEEKKWSFGLYSVLKFSFPKDIQIYTDFDLQPGGGLRAKVIGGGDVDIVVIDGIAIKRDEYKFVDGIPPSEVTSVEIIRFAQDFAPLWWTTDLGNEPPKSLNIIAIFTQAGKGLSGAYRRQGVSEFSVPVFAMVKEYYTPKYDVLNSESWIKPDLRAILHWERSKNTINGKAETSYYNGDLTGDVRVIIEAVSNEGKIGYYEFEYEVLDRKSKKE
ncbi:hypothetical protein MM213_04350 [Belliella sp. R4-6]|uniref:MG2 domain protein n=1 Tax=Belliella alkalica TaxID=1730871 RepID=A0ABS9V8X9_9BACT|nr:hypothetical protein [Belliella alkalica]MCH7412704.1 hypothetical protein [Belliella alkalica]